MLPERFVEPVGFKWADFKDTGGATIRYGSLQPPATFVDEPKGTIVLASGFREPIEKYFEVMRDMTEKGFTVWMMDWHGQGGSDRFVKSNPQKMHSVGYDEHIKTLHQFVTTKVEKSAGPLILMAHSMGAHIGLRYLKENENVFNSAVLTSPMCDVNTSPFPRKLAQMLVNRAQKKGYLENYVPRAGDWKKSEEVFAKNKLTSDPKRFAVLADIFNANAKLIMGGPTYGWTKRTFESIPILREPDYLRAIKTPILMSISGQDKVVDAAASRRAAGFLPNCTRVDIAEARHEIWMERDELRNPWLARVSEFLQGRVDRQKPAPKKPDGNNPPRPPQAG